MPALATTVLIAGMAVGGSTAAVWKSAGTVGQNVITAGDLDVTGGVQTWAETSADVTPPQNPIDPDAFLVRQGDSVTMTQEITTHLQGDNMIGSIGVDWTDPAHLPAGVIGSYEILDGSNAPLAGSTALGTSTALDDDLIATSSGRTDSLSIVVTLDFDGLHDRFASDSADQLSDFGTFTITLEQTRGNGGQP